MSVQKRDNRYSKGYLFLFKYFCVMKFSDYTRVFWIDEYMLNHCSSILFILKGCDFISKSVGKVFEENWKKSVPEDILIYRPPDAAQSFNQTSNLRFSQKSPCDFFMFNGEYLFCIELKTVAGNSISFERDKNDKGIIHYYQIDSLKNFSQYKNVISGLVIDFRKTENTYFVNIKDWDKLIESISKKSFNESDLTKLKNLIYINKKKLKVNYRYDVNNFIKNATSEVNRRD